MGLAVQWVRSLLFNITMYIAMFVISVAFFPFALATRNGAVMACHVYCRWVIWSARWMIGLKVDVRGTPPTGGAIVAAKHQSFFDIIVIYASVPRGRFIMKRELLYTPLVGQYGMRIGCIPVDRGKRGAAIEKLLNDVRAGREEPGQLVIYPQGTRVPPGETRPYKIGSALIYEQLGQTCFPVATNIGLFWPKRSILRKPGVAVVEFLDPIEPGLSKEAFIGQLEDVIETRSNQLMRDEGFSGGVVGAGD